MHEEVFTKPVVALVSGMTVFVLTSLLWAYLGSCN